MITFSVLVPNCLLFQLILSIHNKQYVKFPSENKVKEIQRQFMQQSRIPGIVGAIDCTHIPIQSPGGDTAELFAVVVSRESVFSIFQTHFSIFTRALQSA
jgi:hypothetical protein